MVVLIHFHLFQPNPSIAFSFIQLSFKNQDRLTRKIVGSYSRVFTVNHTEIILWKVLHNEVLPKKIAELKGLCR